MILQNASAFKAQVCLFRSLKPDEADIKSSEQNEEGMVEEPPFLLQKMRADIFREYFLNLREHLLHKGSVNH